MSQHVSHRHSDEVHELHAKIERLTALAIELTDALENALNFGADRGLVNRARRELEPKP